MALILRCACGRLLKVRDEFAGRRVQHKACGHVLVAPARKAPVPPAAAVVSPTGPATGPALPTRRARPAPWRGKVVIAGAVVLFASGLALGLGTRAGRPDRPIPAAAPPAPVVAGAPAETAWEKGPRQDEARREEEERQTEARRAEAKSQAERRRAERERQAARERAERERQAEEQRQAEWREAVAEVTAEMSRLESEVAALDSRMRSTAVQPGGMTAALALANEIKAKQNRWYELAREKDRLTGQQPLSSGSGRAPRSQAGYGDIEFPVSVSSTPGVLK